MTDRQKQHVKALQEMRQVMIEDDNWESLKRFIEAVTAGGMTIQMLDEKAFTQPKTGHWNNHQIACMLADLFGDTCACNYNDIDEWLPKVCDFKDNCCPNPVGVACWEQFLKYSQSRYTECGYEVRDNAKMVEPQERSEE